MARLQAGEVRTCPRCGEQWKFNHGHFFCHPRDMSEVVEPLVAILKGRGMTLKMIGAELGVDRRTISAWLYGRQNPSPDHLAALKSLAIGPQPRGRQ